MHNEFPDDAKALQLFLDACAEWFLELNGLMWIKLCQGSRGGVRNIQGGENLVTLCSVKNCSSSSINQSSPSSYPYVVPFVDIDAFDTEHLISCMEKLRHGLAVDVPNYDFITHKRKLPPRKVYQSYYEHDKVNPSDVIILEGILVFHDSRVREMMNMKIFVDTDADVRLARRIRRDTAEKGRDLKTVLDQVGLSIFAKHSKYGSSSDRWTSLDVYATCFESFAIVLQSGGYERIDASVSLGLRKTEWQMDELGMLFRGEQLAKLGDLLCCDFIPPVVPIDKCMKGGRISVDLFEGSVHHAVQWPGLLPSGSGQQQRVQKCSGDVCGSVASDLISTSGEPA
ncbi:hypothetical protein ZIOFF_057006 [Zingiber officinale]|uniref:Phosphoribulokinase/uridine kinase domain-containing protein n=1 Tax=Zingiber officinale TaxID=94328 RepID=A0A8J5FHP9_ZINOF|nr:hypothetical protein ZIOFF_057006 [Zingiber officinale]